MIKTLVRFFNETLDNSKKIDVISALTTSASHHSLLDKLYIYKYFKHYYGYIIQDPSTKALLAFDCGDYGSSRFNTQRLIKQTGGKFSHLFLTHKHPNHSIGAKEWNRVYQELTVVSGCKVAPIQQICQDGQIYLIGDISVYCMKTPGHTDSDFCYVVTQINESSNKTPLVFTGDTLFIGGVGKISEGGSYQKLFQSLKLLKNLPNQTLIFPGHQNALENLAFAKLVDSKNEFVNKKLEWAKEKKRNMSLGSMMSEERLYNPFFRTAQRHFQELTGETDEFQVFTKLHQVLHKVIKTQIFSFIYHK